MMNNDASVQWNIFGEFGTMNVIAPEVEIGVIDTGVTNHPALMTLL